MKYVKLDDVEKILIKRIDWKSDMTNPVEIRNDLLESLDMIDCIEISENCKYCSKEYDQAIEAICVRHHSDNNESLHYVNVNYCPVCGRKLR